MKNHLTTRFIVTCLAALSLATHVQCQTAREIQSEIADAISSLEQYKAGDGTARLELATKTFTRYLADYGTADNFNNLLAIAADPDVHPTVRFAVLKACLTECRQETMSIVADHLLRWAAQFDEEFRANGHTNFGEYNHLINRLKTAMSGPDSLDALVEIVSSGKQGENFLRWLLTSEVAAGMNPNPGFELLARADLPALVKEQLVYDLIRSSRDGGSPASVNPYLTAGSEARLMAIVRSSGKEYTSVNRFAIEILANNGSDAVREYIVANRESLRTFHIDGITDREAVRYQATIDFRMKQWIAMVDLQQSDDSLLSFIASDELTRSSVPLREWAIARAVERRIAFEKIQISIYQHLEHLLAEQNQADKQRQYSLQSVEQNLRESALRAGVVTEDDWPPPFPLINVRPDW